MRNILFLTVLVFMFTACTDDISEYNVDTKNPEAVPASSLQANATVALFDWLASPNVNENPLRLWAQQWAQTQYTDESNYELVARNINGRTWNTMYSTVLRDLREAKAVITADELLTAGVKSNQLAAISIMESYTWTYMVDIFGNIPFSAAFGDDVTPAYDDAASIYTAAIGELNKAIDQIDLASAGMASDVIYGGDAASWKKFGNSLKLKLAIRLADSDDARAKGMAEAAVASGVFESSADNFQIAYQGSPPNTNPVWEDLVESGRFDFVAANTLGDYLNALNDPRRSLFYRALDDDGDVIGGIYGDNNTYNVTSQPNSVLEDPTLPGIIMSYSEVQFLLADAAERGYSVGGSAADFYTKGVTSSIMAWGGSADDAAAYLAQADVAYDSAPGTWKEKIALQKWIALYNMGFEAWTTYRVYDAPVMNLAAQRLIVTPKRYTYPVTEFSLNGESRDAAEAAMGGDAFETSIFWDVN